MPVVYFLIESAVGTVELLACRTTLEAMVALQTAMDERTDARRLTISEDGHPVYSTQRERAGWREDRLG